jgi:hypothetical protein
MMLPGLSRAVRARFFSSRPRELSFRSGLEVSCAGWLLHLDLALHTRLCHNRTQPIEFLPERTNTVTFNCRPLASGNASAVFTLMLCFKRAAQVGASSCCT